MDDDGDLDDAERLEPFRIVDVCVRMYEESEAPGISEDERLAVFSRIADLLPPAWQAIQPNTETKPPRDPVPDAIQAAKAAWSCGTLFMWLGDADRALDAFMAVSRLASSRNELRTFYAPSSMNVGLLLSRRGERDAAIATWSEALSHEEEACGTDGLSVSYAQMAYALAGELYQTQEWPKALEATHRALRALAPTDAGYGTRLHLQVLAVRRDVFRAIGRLAEAIQVDRTIVVVGDGNKNCAGDPEVSAALWHALVCLVELREFDKVQQTATELLERYRVMQGREELETVSSNVLGAAALLADASAFGKRGAKHEGLQALALAMRNEVMTHAHAVGGAHASSAAVEAALAINRNFIRQGQIGHARRWQAQGLGLGADDVPALASAAQRRYERKQYAEYADAILLEMRVMEICGALDVARQTGREAMSELAGVDGLEARAGRKLIQITVSSLGRSGG